MRMPGWRRIIGSDNKPLRDDDMFNDSNSAIPYVPIEVAEALTSRQLTLLTAFLSSEAMRISKRTISALNPEFTEREIAHKFIDIHHGKELADGMREWEKTRAVIRQTDDTCKTEVTPS